MDIKPNDTAREWLDSIGCEGPDEVGTSEYRAVHETLEGAIDNYEYEEPTDHPNGDTLKEQRYNFALTVLEELADNIRYIRNKIVVAQAKEAASDD